MKKICLFILFTVQSIFASEASLKIENFVEDGGGTVTFDIMISNDVDVSAVQLNVNEFPRLTKDHSKLRQNTVVLNTKPLLRLAVIVA